MIDATQSFSYKAQTPPRLKHIQYGHLPNLRRLMKPRRGYTFIDLDLDRADLYVVIWEADDEELRKAVMSGVDMHLYNAAVIFNLSIPEDELVETHAQCSYWKDRYYKERQKAKMGVHATNYGVGDAKLAGALGLLRSEAAAFKNRWFSAHPGIKKWHVRTANQLAKNKTITNIYGYRIVYFDRPDRLLTEALAWVPQSTVAITIDRAMDNIATNLSKEVDIVGQVHDSLVLEVATDQLETIAPRIVKEATVTAPYPLPMTIPVGLKVSSATWGDCEPYTLKKELHVPAHIF